MTASFDLFLLKPAMSDSASSGAQPQSVGGRSYIILYQRKFARQVDHLPTGPSPEPLTDGVRDDVLL